MAKSRAERLFEGPGEMRARCREFDWARTELGPVESWPQSLSSAVQIVLASPLPMRLIWWPALRSIYNDAYRVLIGSRHPRAFGQTITEMWPEYGKYQDGLFARVRAGESLWLEETAVGVERSPGEVEEAWFSRTYSPVRDEAGEVAGMLVTVLDSTARKQAELRHSFLLDLYDHLRLLIDAREIMATAAELLARHLGLATVRYSVVDADEDSAEIVAEYCDDRRLQPDPSLRFRFSERAPGWLAPLRAGQDVFSENLPEDRELMTGAAKTRGVRSVAAYPLLKKGKLVAVLWAAHDEPRRWSDADRTLFREVGERTWSSVERARAEARLRENEQRLRATAEAAREANRAKDEFLATLSHELRTPLAPILLWGRSLKSGGVAMSDWPRAVDAIVASAEAQSRLIEDLLDLSRLKAGKLQLAQRETLPVDAARAAVEVLRPTAAGKGVTMSFEADADLGSAVLDPDRFQQVLWNLLSNAVKFTPSGGSVSLRIRKRERMLEAEVTDTGVGIPSEFLPRLFERFQQADMRESRRHTGLGIGLALCRHLVELHGGSIEAKSEGTGRGAVFTVRIPWVETPGESQRPSKPEEPAAPPPRLAGLVLLLVEDDPSTREAMRWALERAGAVVRVASSGPEALAALEGDEVRSIDAMICDIGLPGMSGYELVSTAANARRVLGLRPLPAIAVSAHARGVDRRRAIEAGFVRHLAKPVSPEELLAAVELLAGRGA